MIEKTEQTFSVDIFMAGDVAQAKHVCREFCREVGLCVTVTETAFIYTGGEEAGVRIGLVNYPRFPDTPHNILNKAERLARLLLDRLFQDSVLLVTRFDTKWITRRE